MPDQYAKPHTGLQPISSQSFSHRIGKPQSQSINLWDEPPKRRLPPWSNSPPKPKPKFVPPKSNYPYQAKHPDQVDWSKPYRAVTPPPTARQARGIIATSDPEIQYAHADLYGVPSSYNFVTFLKWFKSVEQWKEALKTHYGTYCLIQFHKPQRIPHPDGSNATIEAWFSENLAKTIKEPYNLNYVTFLRNICALNKVNYESIPDYVKFAKDPWHNTHWNDHTCTPETNLLIISGIENERPIVCPKLVICALLKFPVIERRWSNEMNLCMKAMVRANWLNG
ncbi:hypothetical protein LguiB_036295 [Lonicera macranthoides]